MSTTKRSKAGPRITLHFRYRLRSLLVILSVTAMWFGWFMHRVTQQRRAVEAITQLGGTVWYGSAGFNPLHPRTWSQRLGTAIGPDYFFPVVGVKLSDTQVTDADLKHLDSLRQVRSLWLSSTAVGDDGMVYLENLSKLRLLHLSSTRVSDFGMRSVGKLTDLDSLFLGVTAVGDAGVRSLASLGQMQRLDLRSTLISANALRHLRGMQALRELRLENTKARGAEILNIAEVQHVEILGYDQ